jgi:hypothetical protein
MRKFSNIKSVVVMKYVIIGHQVVLTGMATFGIIRVIIGLIMGEFANVSFGILQ